MVTVLCVNGLLVQGVSAEMSQIWVQNSHFLTALGFCGCWWYFKTNVWLIDHIIMFLSRCAMEVWRNVPNLDAKHFLTALEYCGFWWYLNRNVVSVDHKIFVMFIIKGSAEISVTDLLAGALPWTPLLDDTFLFFILNIYQTKCSKGLSQKLVCLSRALSLQKPCSCSSISNTTLRSLLLMTCFFYYGYMTALSTGILTVTTSIQLHIHS